MHRVRRAMHVIATASALTLMLSGGLAASANAAPSSRTASFPEVIQLPAGFGPEGIATGRGSTFYVGSIRGGAIYRGDYATGNGAVLVPAVDGQSAGGLEVDRWNRVWVAGGLTGGGARVYDGDSGELLASYQLSDAASLINDIVISGNTVYFSNSNRAVVHAVPLGRHGALPDASKVRDISITGDLVFDPDAFIVVNGIEASPDGRTLFLTKSATGALYALNIATGVTKELSLSGGTLTYADGLLRIGRTLYAVQGGSNQIAVARFSRDFRSATVTGTLTDSDLDGPSTAAAFGPFLYAVNARFGGSGDQYQVVRVKR